MMNLEIIDDDKENSDTKNTIANILNNYNIVKFTNENGFFSVEIEDRNTFEQILKLFFYLYTLEKLYSLKYSVHVRDDKNSKDSKSTKSESHLKSSIPKTAKLTYLKLVKRRFL